MPPAGMISADRDHFIGSGQAEISRQEVLQTGFLSQHPGDQALDQSGEIVVYLGENAAVRAVDRTDRRVMAASAGSGLSIPRFWNEDWYTSVAGRPYRSSSTPISSFSPQALTYCAFPTVPGPLGPIS